MKELLISGNLTAGVIDFSLLSLFLRADLVVKSVIIILIISICYLLHYLELNNIDKIMNLRFTYQNILDKAGIYLNAEPKSAKEQREEADTILDSVMPDEPLSSSSSSDYSNLSLKELNKMLDQAVSKEDYEQAALLRDEISKRN